MKAQALPTGLALAAVLLGAGLSGWVFGKALGRGDVAPARTTEVTVAPADARDSSAASALQRDIAALAPQRPGHPDLYVLGFAGDGSEQVFRNEVLHLEALAAQRLDAAGRVLVLANHSHEPIRKPLPRATLANLEQALAAIGAAMDPEEDVLLLYVTTHGTSDHELLLRTPGEDDDFIVARDLRKALDASGIRHRVLALSACYSGGFVRALRDEDTLLLTAAHRDRPSFGCGNDSVATYFGRAWLVDGLNDTVDFDAAFDAATQAIERREIAAGLAPSQPQINRGRRIGERLALWRASFTPGPAVPYPFEDPTEDAPETAEAALTPPLLRGDSSPPP